MNIARSTTGGMLAGAIATLALGVLDRVGITLSPAEAGAVLTLITALTQHYVSDEDPSTPPTHPHP